MKDCSLIIKQEQDYLVDDDTWTSVENKKFEIALSRFFSEPDRFTKICSELCNKSVHQVEEKFKKLQEDIELIEAGVYQPPDWQDSTETKKLKDPSCLERRKGIPWTEEEHQLFLLGLSKFGKGDWRSISRNFVVSRTPTQVASHAQKYFIRLNSLKKKEKKPPQNLELALLKNPELLSKTFMNNANPVDLLAHLPIASNPFTTTSMPLHCTAAFTTCSMPLHPTGSLTNDAAALALSSITNHSITNHTIPNQFTSVGMLGPGSAPPPLTIPQGPVPGVDDASHFSVDSLVAVSTSMGLSPPADVAQHSPHLQTLSRQLSAAQLSGPQLNAMHLANGNVAAVAAAAAAAAAQRFSPSPQVPLMSVFGGVPNGGLHGLPVQGYMAVPTANHPRPHLGLMSPHSSNSNAAYMNM